MQNLNRIIDTLSRQHQSIESKGPKAILAWKINWLSLKDRIKEIEKNDLYSFALQDIALQKTAFSVINEALKNKYDFKVRPLETSSLKLLHPGLKKIQGSIQYYNAEIINEALRENPDKTYKTIFGEPKSQSSKELRYAGGLIVTLHGKNSGLWHDFSEGVGGAPIQAIMKSHKLNYKEAVRFAASLAGIDQPQDMSNESMLKNKLPISEKGKSEHKNKIICVQSIWDSCVSAEGTLAEKYLKQHRGINNIAKLDIRFWPVGAAWKNINEYGAVENKNNKIPALVFAARNEKGELTGVQRIYLDQDTAAKNKFMKNPKKSKGIIAGSCNVIQKGMKGARLYIAEGPETAASIAVADSKATVLASFGVANIKNLGAIINKFKSKDIIIAADNDGDLAKSKEVVFKIIEKFKQENIAVRAIFPEAVNEKSKTDWNDVLLNQGVVALRNQLYKNGVKDVPLSPEISIDKTKDILRNNHAVTAINDSLKINSDDLAKNRVYFPVNRGLPIINYIEKERDL